MNYVATAYWTDSRGVIHFPTRFCSTLESAMDAVKQWTAEGATEWKIEWKAKP